MCGIYIDKKKHSHTHTSILQFCTVVASVNRSGPRKNAQIELTMTKMENITDNAIGNMLNSVQEALSQDFED